MTVENQKYIKENRLRISMVDIASEIKISYNKVRSYMIQNNLTLSKKEIERLKALKRKSNNRKPKNWDALL